MPGLKDFGVLETEIEGLLAGARRVLDAMRPRPTSSLADMRGLLEALPDDEMEFDAAAAPDPRSASAPPVLVGGAAAAFAPAPAPAPAPVPVLQPVTICSAPVHAVRAELAGMEVEKSPSPTRASRVRPIKEKKGITVPRRSERRALKKDIPEGSRKRTLDYDGADAGYNRVKWAGIGL